MRLALVLTALLFAPTASAQDEPTGETPLAPGARALLFQVGPDLSVRGLSGSTLSYKHHRSEARALRLGLTVLAQAEIGLDGPARDTETLTIAGTLLPLHYRRSRTPVYLYTGIGPTAQVQVARQDTEGVDATVLLVVGAGLAGVVGVEWVVAPAIGLTAEYGQALTVNGLFSDGNDKLQVSLDQRGPQVGFAVYF